MKKIILIILFYAFFVVGKTSAHQLRVSSGIFTEIKVPEVTQAFNGELKGEADTYQINSDKSFNLYVGLLVANEEGIEMDKDLSATISKDGEQFYFLDGRLSKWQDYYERHTKKHYFFGPEFKADDSNMVVLKGVNVGNGVYTIKVFSPDNFGKYTLVVGEKNIISTTSAINNIRSSAVRGSEFFGQPILAMFVGTNAIYWLVPVFIIFLFLVAGIAITVKLSRDRYKEGLGIK